MKSRSVEARHRYLVTGGTGYIGSHFCVALLDAGHDVIVVDDGSNSHPGRVGECIERVAGRGIVLQEFDVADTARLATLLEDEQCDAIVHFASSKHVRESMNQPAHYLANNVGGLTSVVLAAHGAGVKRLLFSSSGSVYGDAAELPIKESSVPAPTNPYSASKALGESALQALCNADESWSVVALRYFNPAGAHPSGLLGDDPLDQTKNLLPKLIDAALDPSIVIDVLGDDYPTPDGSGVRDYVHVCDVADTHLAATNALFADRGFRSFNVGRGEGVSVFELIRAVERATGRPISTRIEPRSAGDVASLFADTTLVQDQLGSSATRSLDQICEDALRFRLSQNASREAS